MTHLPKFSPALLHPRYWLLWLGIGLLWLVVQLPYPLIYRLGNAIGRLAMRFMKRRAKIAYRNLELCFPEKSEQERHRMVVMNFESVGMGADGDRYGLVLASSPNRPLDRHHRL
ncbi:lipid A biosynthesis (KDO) 2-(lauroyl)-lipid IVA acyltransferase [Klebsiella quasipneumoniae]|nr:lipid A biosynthesis (KDO) 2-(lauroyl)-lipid IVA acyltransferase [Klebsiella quasipneumoniae]